MNDSNQLIQDLIDRLNSLSDQDYLQLDALQKSIRLIVKKIFPDDEVDYLKDLKEIKFSNPYYSNDVLDEGEWWNAGKVRMSNLLNNMLENIQLSRGTLRMNSTLSNNAKSSKRIFVVHGHDGEMEHSVARTLEILGLQPIILHAQAHQGRTIIEDIDYYSDVSSAVVLLSPDDKGYAQKDGQEKIKLRARQNVILELGYFIGKLGRDRVFALSNNLSGDLELPSDYLGVLYISYDRSDGWRFKLAKELKASGYDVDANKLL